MVISLQFTILLGGEHALLFVTMALLLSDFLSLLKLEVAKRLVRQVWQQA